MAILKPTPSPTSTTESATNRIDLDQLSAALMAAGIPFVQWKHYIHINGLQGCDVFSDGDVFVGTERIGGDELKALAFITQHTTRAPRRSRDQAGMAGEETK